MTQVSEISVQHHQLLPTCKNEKLLQRLPGGPARLGTVDTHHPKELLTYIDDRYQIFTLHIFKLRF